MNNHFAMEYLAHHRLAEARDDAAARRRAKAALVRRPPTSAVARAISAIIHRHGVRQDLTAGRGASL